MQVGLSARPIDTEAFSRMHDAALRAFGGCPEECVYDQTKLVVLREEYRELTLNGRFHEYATQAGFRIRACEGFGPESKGRVEAGVKYVRSDALYGERFADWAALEAHLAEWLSTAANLRCHGTTGQAPRALFEADEQHRLQPYLTPAVVHSSALALSAHQVEHLALVRGATTGRSRAGRCRTGLQWLPVRPRRLRRGPFCCAGRQARRHDSSRTMRFPASWCAIVHASCMAPGIRIRAVPASTRRLS